MMYPRSLNPAYTTSFQLQDKVVEVPKCIIQFQKWMGLSVKETFGGKPFVSMDGKPMFAEMAIMTHFLNDGWNARWVETYGRRNKEPIYLSEWKDESYTKQKHEPIEQEKVIEIMKGIARINNACYAGCWDIVSWKDERVVFAEAKRNNKDFIRSTQNKWLAAGLSFGLKPDNFLLVQWDFNPRCMA